MRTKKIRGSFGEDYKRGGSFSEDFSLKKKGGHFMRRSTWNYFFEPD